MFKIKHLVMVALLVVSVMVSARADDGFMPAWRVGDSWLIESSHLKNDPLGEAWTSPVRWLFEVKNEKDVDGVSCFVLYVTPKGSHHSRTQAILCLSKLDLHPVRVVDVSPVSGRADAKERRFDGERLSPLFSGESLIPYDLPMFPLAATPAGETLDRSAAVAGEAASEVDGITFVDTTAQSWDRTDRGYRVTLDAGDGRGALVQEWVEGEPWAVAMTGRDVKCTLVAGEK